MRHHNRFLPLIVKAFALFGGWLILAIVAGMAVWLDHVAIGLTIIGGLGLAAALLSFPTYHMPAVMMLVIGIAALRIQYTPVGLFLPWLVGGYMFSVWIEDMVLGEVTEREKGL